MRSGTVSIERLFGLQSEGVTVNTQPIPSYSATRSSAPLAAVRQARYIRRRLVAIAVLAAVVFALGVLIGSAGATADIANPVAGYEVVAEGETLWDIAVRTTPEGSDPRRHLAEIRNLNGLTGSSVKAWTVVAIPAQ